MDQSLDAMRIEECALYFQAQLIVAGNEIGKEFVQAVLEDIVHFSVAQPGMKFACQPLAFDIASPGKLFKDRRDFCKACMQ